MLRQDVTLTFDPLTLNVCILFFVTLWNSTKFQRNRTIRDWVMEIESMKIWAQSAILDFKVGGQKRFKAWSSWQKSRPIGNQPGIYFADKDVVIRAKSSFCRQQKPDEHWCWLADFIYKQLSLGRHRIKPPTQKCIWSRYDLDLWPVTLKTFSAVATYVMNIHTNPS